MAYALVNHTVQQSTNTNGFTTTGIDTSGGDTLFVYISWYYGGGGTAALDHDSNGNSFTALTVQDDGTNGRSLMYYAKNATCGAGHTFTTTGNGTYVSITVTAFSGGDTTAPFDTETGHSVGGTSTTNQTGSVSPSVDNEVVITGFGNVDSVGTLSIDSSFTKSDSADRAANSLGNGMGYIIQTTKGAVNPTWSYTSANASTTRIACFKPSSGAPPAAAGWGPLFAGKRNSPVMYG